MCRYCHAENFSQGALGAAFRAAIDHCGGVLSKDRGVSLKQRICSGVCSQITHSRDEL